MKTIKTRIFSTLAVVFFLNASFASDIPNNNIAEDEQLSCHDYAVNVGLIYAGGGLSYWEGYFAGYAYCAG